MFELSDEILAQLSANVNKKSELIENNINNTNWQLIDKDHNESKKTAFQNPDQYNTQINKAYSTLEQRAQVNNLSDSFCSESFTEIRSATERSLAKAIARYARQHSIIQAYC